jgi:hypothetical protein
MTEIVSLSAELEPAYTRFVRAAPAAMIYYSLEFREFLQRTAGGTPDYEVAVQGDRIVGVLPCLIKRHPTYGDVINSLPWYGSYGGCLVADNADAGVRRLLLERISRKMKAPSTAFATLIMSPHEHAHLREYTDTVRPDVTDVRIGQFTRLPPDRGDVETALEQLCRQKTRNLVRKALRQGFSAGQSDDEESWRFLHRTHAENIAALGGRAKPWEHFEAIRRSIPASSRQLWLATFEGTPVAALLLLRYNTTVEYLTPVIKHDWRARQPLSFLIWHAMLEAIHSGYRMWNWGGTWLSQTSLHHFKAGWGAIDVPYSYLVTARADARVAYAADRPAMSAMYPYYYLYPDAALRN